MSPDRRTALLELLPILATSARDVTPIRVMVAVRIASTG
jgi:hypothetical protein